jgi:hypothetical protein
MDNFPYDVAQTRRIGAGARSPLGWNALEIMGFRVEGIDAGRGIKNALY